MLVEPSHQQHYAAHVRIELMPVLLKLYRAPHAFLVLSFIGVSSKTRPCHCRYAAKVSMLGSPGASNTGVCLS